MIKVQNNKIHRDYYICGSQCGICNDKKQYLAEESSLLISASYLTSLKHFHYTNLKQPIVGIDLGAHIGLYGIALDGIVDRMYSFEPALTSYKALELNSKKYTSIIPVNYAASDEDGILYFNEKNHTFHEKISHKEIKAIKLDNFIKERNINFIKLDIEGHESYALVGARNILKKSTKCIIIMEHCPHHYINRHISPKAVYDFLKDCGFCLVNFAEPAFYSVNYGENINTVWIKV